MPANWRALAIGLALAALAAACAPAAPAPQAEIETAEKAAEGAQEVPTVPQPTAAPAVDLADLGPAPELTNTIWRNTPGNQPLRLADLRGKVVALEFWNSWNECTTRRDCH